MYPRTVTILLAGCALVAPSCTTKSFDGRASIPAFEAAYTGIDDPIGGSIGGSIDGSIDGPIGDPISEAFTLDRAVLASPPMDGDGEPQRRRRREQRPRRAPPFSAFGMLSFATGDYEFEDDFLGKDDSHAYMHRIQAAGVSNQGIGGGIDFKFIVPGDDFYERTINVTDVNQSDLYAFFLAHVTGGRFRMPVRVGPYFSAVRAEFEVTGDDTYYDSFGLRVEIQPEIVIVDSGDGEASIYSRLSAGAHDSVIDDESTDEHYHSHGFTLGLEAGVRFVVGPVAFGAAYVYHENTISESDDENGLVIPRLETSFDGFQFGVGVKF